ncbi:MAG: tRNA 2-selenouridine(34) synthase MnmH, partial [Rhodobacteraceae bacterium]|nr:tRNA 2-selenouridine(34) synthase MnmH [Paracoccaceae bacterium]
DRERLDETIALLRPLHAAEVIEAWGALAAAGDFAGLAEDLMRRHYDPRYNRHRDRFDAAPGEVVEAPSLLPEALDGLADKVLAAVGRHAG